MRRLLLASVVLAALLVPAVSASAAPTGEFARFAKCPTSNPVVDFCLFSETTSGSFTLGNKTVPVKNPVALQAGIQSNGNLYGPLTLYGATDGNTLTKVPQPVPGGLLGVTAPSWWPSILRDLFNETINNGFTGVTATLELAASPSAIKLGILPLVTGQGTGLTLPVKVKLGNPFLGSSCYIGSNSSPIMLNFTTGTTAPPPPNTPITGSPGAFEILVENKIIAVRNNRLVDNSFSAPGANGCGGILFSWAVDPFVNSIVGVPAAAGKNAAILEGSTFIGYAPAVKASEP